MYVINRILHDHLEMQNVTFCVGKNFVSPYGHVISSIFGTDGNQPLTNNLNLPFLSFVSRDVTFAVNYISCTDIYLHWQ